MSGHEPIRIDLKKSMAVIGNNQAVYLRLLKRFVDSPLMSELEQAAATGDMEAMQAKAHAIKGMCGNMRFDAVYELSKDAESELKAGKPLTPGDGLLKALSEAYSATVADAQSYIDDPSLLPGA